MTSLLSRALRPFAATLLLVCISVVAQAPPSFAKLAPTPPMGWNSWDAYGLTIDEAAFRENSRVLATLRPLGWNYAVIDEGWYMHNPLDRGTPERLRYQIDSNGRFEPSPERFPSAMENGRNTGFATLGRDVHALGLRFGIHIIRGIPKESVERNAPIAGSRFHAADAVDRESSCPWDPTSWGVRDSAAGQAWYDSLARQYSGWGVDYIKVDCVSDHPYRPAEIRMLQRAIVHSGRAMVLSLSPGPTSPSLASEVAAVSQMWRISDDVWDSWNKSGSVGRGVRDQFPLVAAWTPFARPGSWPDADMLPFGHLGPIPGEGRDRDTRLTTDEQRTLLTLWSIARSPLILGANLTRLDAATRELISNTTVIALDQHGSGQRQVAREGNIVAWTSHLGGRDYLALFNLNDTERKLARTFAEYNLDGGPYSSHEVWTGVNAASAPSFAVTIAPHGCVVLELTRKAQSSRN